jgi:hypothetical protein
MKQDYQKIIIDINKRTNEITTAIAHRKSISLSSSAGNLYSSSLK